MWNVIVCFCRTCKIPRKGCESNPLCRRCLEAQEGFSNIILCWTGLSMTEAKWLSVKGTLRLDSLPFSMITKTRNREERLLFDSRAGAVLCKSICFDNYGVERWQTWCCVSHLFVECKEATVLFAYLLMERLLI